MLIDANNRCVPWAVASKCGPYSTIPYYRRQYIACRSRLFVKLVHVLFTWHLMVAAPWDVKLPLIMLPYYNDIKISEYWEYWKHLPYTIINYFIVIIIKYWLPHMYFHNWDRKSLWGLSLQRQTSFRNAVHVAPRIELDFVNTSVNLLT